MEVDFSMKWAQIWKDTGTFKYMYNFVSKDQLFRKRFHSGESTPFLTIHDFQMKMEEFSSSQALLGPLVKGGEFWQRFLRLMEQIIFMLG